jgi:hypothetical protein
VAKNRDKHVTCCYFCAPFMEHLFRVIATCWLFGVGSLVLAQSNSLSAHYTQENIRLDGQLNETAWLEAQRISNFTQRELVENAPATERTEVAIVYTDRNLYIGVWCYDSQAHKITAKEFRRDFNRGLEDNFQVVIDTYNDKRNGFLFAINPNAARADFQVFDNGKSTNTFWNGVWDARTTITSEGWFAEIEIPFSTLKFETHVEGPRVWGINFERNIQSKREQVLWQGWTRDAGILWVNRAGQLTGLDSVQNRQFVELKPYAISGAQNQQGNPGFLYNFGGDINYLLTPTYRLNVTLNTDFAQVESDQQQINLTRFPLFFPELREFFLEGEDFFDMGFGGNRIVPFYSRRIGLDADREPVPIIGGARLLGKEGGSTIGAMSIQAAGTENELPTNYTVLSWRQDILEQSTVGLMTVNKIVDGRWHTTTGANFRYSTSKIFGNKNLNAGGALITTQNTDTAFDPQAYAYRFFLQYPNDRINIFASAQKSPEPFEPEVGLMRRRNFEEFFAVVNLRPRPAETSRLRWIRQWDFVPAEITYTVYNDTRVLQSFLYVARPFGFSTRRGEFFQLNYELHGEGLIVPFKVPGQDVVIPVGTYYFHRGLVRAGTFAGRTFSVNAAFSAGQFFDGHSVQQNYGIRFRASKYLSITGFLEQNTVDVPQGAFNATLMGNRLEYAFTPNLFGLIFTQWSNTSDLLIFNFRLQWIPIIGADFFFIVNHVINTGGEQWEPVQSAVAGKLIWRFAI